MLFECDDLNCGCNKNNVKGNLGQDGLGIAEESPQADSAGG